MASILNESDIQTLHELLDVVFATESTDDGVQEALVSLKSMIELDEPAVQDEDEEKREEDAEYTSSKNRITSMKQHILVARPNFFKHLLKLPEDEEAEVDYYLASSKVEAVTELLRNFSPAKLAFMPLVESLLLSSFREDPSESLALRAQDEATQNTMAELLCPDPAAREANRLVQEALSKQIQSFSDVQSPNLLAEDMTLELAKKQRALAAGLCNIANAPLKPSAVPAFLQAGGLDALLTIVLRGSFSASVLDLESPNASLEDAYSAICKLMEDSSCKELAQALVERQAISPLFEQLSHICDLEGIYSGSSAPRALAVLSKSDQTLQQLLVAQAQKMVVSDPKDLGPSAATVLFKLLQAAEEYEIEGMEKISQSNNYVPFFLASCKRDASYEVLDAVGDALAARIAQPGDQLRKGISTPEQVERFVTLLEFPCTQHAADISPTMQVLRELVLPTDPEDTGGFYNPDDEIKRVDKEFCKAFGVAMGKRYEAAQALAPKKSGDEVVIEEPSEEGLANMKIVNMLTPIVEEQYSTVALLAGGLLDYLQYLVFNPSPLSRRAGIELLTTLTHDSSLSSDFQHVPDLIEGFKGAMVYFLDDSRALIRALAMQWLTKIMSYRHPNGQNMYKYKPAIDFVTESVKPEKLSKMLKGTENEAIVAAGMIEAMARHSRGLDIRDKFKKTTGLMEGLWNGVFWDAEKAPESKDGDISDEVYFYGNIQPSCGDALTQILDPFTDNTSIAEHIASRIAEFKEKEPYEFTEFLTKMPAVASFAVMSPETEVLSAIGKMISNEDQLPYAMTALRHLSQGVMLAKVSLGQSDEVYPALVKVLQEGEESNRATVLDDLESLLFASTASKAKFLKSGGIAPLLEIIPLEDYSISRKATSSLVSLITDFPEGSRAAINAGAVTVLESKEDPSDMFERVPNALALLKELKDAPLVDRIEFTPEAYAAFGKTLSAPEAIVRLIQNLKSSMDEKQLIIAGGILPVLAEMLRSGSNPLLVLEALYTIYVADGVILSGLNLAATAGEACGLPDALKPLMESEDHNIKEYAKAVRSAVLMEQNDELRNVEGDEEQEEKDGEPEENPEEVD